MTMDFWLSILIILLLDTFKFVRDWSRQDPLRWQTPLLSRMLSGGGSVEQYQRFRRYYWLGAATLFIFAYVHLIGTVTAVICYLGFLFWARYKLKNDPAMATDPNLKSSANKNLLGQFFFGLVILIPSLLFCKYGSLPPVGRLLIGGTGTFVGGLLAGMSAVRFLLNKV